MSERYFIVGTNHRSSDEQAAFKALIEGDRLKLRREPTNKYDANAIQVVTEEGMVVGYVRSGQAAKLAPMIDSKGAPAIDRARAALDPATAAQPIAADAALPKEVDAVFSITKNHGVPVALLVEG